MTEHPITPPPELFKQWEDNILFERDNVDHVLDCAWRHGFHTGADQELEACCEWLNRELGTGWGHGTSIRAARRPKPPSLKERALQAWAAIEAGTDDQTAMAVIRRALEALPE